MFAIIYFRIFLHLHFANISSHLSVQILAKMQRVHILTICLIIGWGASSLDCNLSSSLGYNITYHHHLQVLSISNSPTSSGDHLVHQMYQRQEDFIFSQLTTRLFSSALKDNFIIFLISSHHLLKDNFIIFLIPNAVAASARLVFDFL